MRTDMRPEPWMFLLFLLIKSWCIATTAAGLLLWTHRGKGPFNPTLAMFCLSVGIMGLMEFGAMAWDRSLGHEFGHRSSPAMWTYWIGHAWLCLHSWLLLGFFIWRKNGSRS